MTTLTNRVSAALEPLVGNRVSPLIALDPPVKPYIVYTRIGSAVMNALAGTPLIEQTRLQVDIYCDQENGGYSMVQQLATGVKAAIHATFPSSTLELEQDLYEDGVKLYRIMLDFSIWGN